MRFLNHERYLLGLEYVIIPDKLKSKGYRVQPTSKNSEYLILSEQISVIYNGISGSDFPKIDKVYYGASYTISNCNLNRTGYKVSGWNTKADGSGKKYNINQKINTFENQDNMTLYAVWKSENKKQIRTKSLTQRQMILKIWELKMIEHLQKIKDWQKFA